MALKKGAEAHDAYVQYLIALRWSLVMDGLGGGALATAITTDLSNRGHQ